MTTQAPVHRVWPGLIEAYRDWLPVAATWTPVTLFEGGTPLIHAKRLSELTGCTVHLKVEGLNPTGSFKDRGMTMAVTDAVERGQQAVLCASTGNTSASAAAYAARAGITCAVLIPQGKIAMGKLAQAVMHGAKIIQIDGNFDDCLELARKLTADYPTISLVNSVNPVRIEGQKTAAFEIIEAFEAADREPIDGLCIPVGNAGNITAYWKGFTEMHQAPRMFGFQAEGAAPLVNGAPVERPETVASAIRIGNPARWEEAMTAVRDSRGGIDAVIDAEILDAYRFLASQEGVFCEPASAASVAGLLRHGARGAERIVCVLTGHGLKDPQNALEQAGSVVTCEADLRSVEQAVLEHEALHVAAEPADRAFLDGDQDLVFARQLHDQLDVERLHEARVGDGGGEAMRGEFVGGLLAIGETGAERQ